MNELTKEQVGIMKHSLGQPNINVRWKSRTILDKCYRNRYVVNLDWKPIKELVYRGYMDARTDSSLREGDAFHFVTEKGVDYLKKIKIREVTLDES